MLRRSAPYSIWVADSGPGIADEDLTRIFEPTYQRDAARARAGQWAEDSAEMGGAGLGLAIARGNVELHGGRIWAESPLPPPLRAHLLPLVAEPEAAFRGAALCFSLPMPCDVT